MRTISKYLFLPLLAAFTLVSCNKNEADTIATQKTHFILKASAPATKTVISYADGKYTPYFQKGDKIGLFVNALPTKAGDMVLDAEFANTANDREEALFEGTLDVTPGDVTFYSFYPASAGKRVYINDNTATFGLDIPQSQHPTYDSSLESFSFDPKADILIAKPATATVDASHDAMNTVDMYFARLSAVLRLSINASEGQSVYGERVKNVKIETDNGHIAGRIVVNPLTGDVIGVNEVNGSKAIEATIDDPDACATYIGYQDANNVFIGVAPVSIPAGSNVTFTINTIDAQGHASHKIVKEVSNLGAAIVFESSKPTVINLNIRNSEIGDPDEEDTTNYEGEWVIAGTDNSINYVMSHFLSGNVYPAVVASGIDEDNEIVTVIGTKDPYKMTIEKVDEGENAGLYTIKDANGKYLTATATSSSSQNYLEGKESLANGSYWSISKTEGVLNIIATKVSEEFAREIRVNYNNGKPRFSCYKSSSTMPKVGLYPYEKVIEALAPAATPVISFDNNTITLTCTTEGASIYYNIGTTADNTDDPTAESTQYDANNKPVITANAYIKAIAIAEGYSNSEVAGQALTYQDESTTYYVKVTEAPSDWSGVYLMINTAGTKAFSGAISTTSTKYGLLADITVNNNSVASTAVVDAYAIRIEKSGEYYTIKTANNQYLYWTSGNSLNGNAQLQNENKSLWSITNNNGSISIANGKDPARLIRFNNDRFACYTTNTGTLINLYKLEEGGSTPGGDVVKGSPWESGDFTATSDIEDAIDGVTISSSIDPTGCETTNYSRGMAWGSGNSPVLTLSGYIGGIETVTVVMSTNGGSTSVNVAAGGTTLDSQSVTSGTGAANTEYTFTFSSLKTGDITINVTNTSNKSVWIKSISIN